MRTFRGVGERPASACRGRSVGVRFAAITAVLGVTAVAAAMDEVTIDGRSWYRSQRRVNVFTASTQAEASVAATSTGELVVVWSSRRQQSGRSGVYARRFSSGGIALGPEMPVGLWGRSHQTAPVVAAGPAGEVWLAWTSFGQDGDAGSVIVRRCSNTLLFDGDEQLAHTSTAGHQFSPVIAVDQTGHALVLFCDSDATGAEHVRGRWFDPDGEPLEEAFELPTPRTRTPSVAVDGRGRFHIAVAVADASNRPRGVRLFTIDHAGAVVISHGWRSSPAAITPVIAAVQDGVVLGWLEPRDGGHGGLVQFFDGDGVAVGAPRPVTKRSGHQEGMAIACSSDGDTVVAWTQRAGDDTDVLGRVFRAGVPVADAFVINARHDGRQTLGTNGGATRLASGSDGSLFCVWNGVTPFDASAVCLSRLNRTLRASSPTQSDAAAVVTASKPPAVTAKPHEPPLFDPLGRLARDAGASRFIADDGFDGIVDTGWTPPDPHLAVGPMHLVMMTNGAVAFFDKLGTLLFEDELEGPEGFFGEVGASGFIFDPETVYDPLSGRFFMMAADDSGSTSAFVLAVSDDSNPLGAWHRYRIDTTPEAGGLFDSPNLAVDRDAVYITGDAFPSGPNPYAVYALDKASLLAGQPPAVLNRLTISTASQSAGIPPVSTAPALYLVEHFEGPNRFSLRLYAVRDTLGTPTVTTTILQVPEYDPPEDPPQLGSAVRPETFEARFWRVAYRDGSLWATHHIDSSRVRVRWYEIGMNGWPLSGHEPTLLQQGEVDPGPTTRTFFSAITADDAGNMGLVFAHSSPTDFFSMATAFRYRSDPPGTTRPAIIRRTSTGPYPASRWGDYAAIEVDPANNRTFWAVGEYAVGGSWRTWVSRFTPVFDPADLDFDGAVGITDLLLLLAAWGDCGEPGKRCNADLDGDGSVGIVDLLILLARFG